MIISNSLKKRKNKLWKPWQKKPPKKSTKTDVKEFNESINKEQTGINSEIFRKISVFKGQVRC